MDNHSPYIASLTREKFLFPEMRITARLLRDGLSEAEAIEKIESENLFQYPTERMIRGMARACIKRLKGMEDSALITALAEQPVEIAKQICLYALMQQSRLVWEFMITVIGEKYRLRDSSFGKIDVNAYFLRLQEQDDAVGSWSENTVARLKSVIMNVLVETDYLDNSKSDHLNPVWLYPILENSIRSNGNLVVLPAFNCFK